MTKELTRVPNNEELRAIELIVKNAIDSKYFDKIGGTAGAFSIALYAREMGLPIMPSLFGGVRPVLGKVEISPQMMGAMIRKAGHILQIKEHTYEKCVIHGKRKDTGEEMTVEFSIDDAKRARIYKAGGAWETYPKNMTFKSALSNLAKWLFSDVIGVAYVEGEIEENGEMLQSPVEEDKPVEIKAEPVSPAKKITPEQVNQLEYELDGDERYTQTVLSYYQVDSIEDLPPEKFDFILNKVQMHKNLPKRKTISEEAS